MTLEKTCPTMQDLQRLLLGLMPDEEAIVMARHVKKCGHCLDAMQTLDAEDTMVVNLRAAHEAAQREKPKPKPKPLLEEISTAEFRLPDVPRPAPQPLMPRNETPTRPALPRPDLSPQRESKPPKKSAPAAPPLEEAAESAPPARSAAATPPSPELAQMVAAILAPAESPGEIGRLGPYRILKVLGTGATGIVFQAEDLHLQRVVALKALKPDAVTGEQSQQRFLREARAAAALEHEHIVTIYQVGEDRGVPYLAMQMLKGETLDDKLKREPKLSVAETVRIAREIAAGLGAAHERGLIHRDIKPANIWLETGKGRVKIVDFGLARAVGDSTHLTRTGTIVGTPAYMSPEQARGSAVDFRSDLFSLGCVIYRMIAGITPFQGDDTMSLLLSLAYEQPLPIQQFNPNVPKTLIVLVNRLLAKSIDGRPDSTQTVVEALEIIEREVGPATAGAAAGGAARNQDASPAAPMAPRKLLLIAGVFLLAFLAMLGYSYAPSLMRLYKNQGTVSIAADDPGVEVLVKRNGVVVQERTTQREFDLPAGHYEVEVADKKETWTVTPKRFTLEQGARVIVQIAPNRSKK